MKEGEEGKQAKTLAGRDKCRAAAAASKSHHQSRLKSASLSLHRLRPPNWDTLISLAAKWLPERERKRERVKAESFKLEDQKKEKRLKRHSSFRASSGQMFEDISLAAHPFHQVLPTLFSHHHLDGLHNKVIRRRRRRRKRQQPSLSSRIHQQEKVDSTCTHTHTARRTAGKNNYKWFMSPSECVCVCVRSQCHRFW